MNFFNAETRNRPLWVVATHRDATKPSGARAERRRVAEGQRVLGSWSLGLGVVQKI